MIGGRLPPKKSSMPNIPPMPNKPEHPEKPPSKVPIPGEPEVVGGQRFKCKKCGKVFGSREELEVHVSIEHSAR